MTGASGIRVVRGRPDADELAAVVALLCARGAALAAAAREGSGRPPSGPPAAHWPRRSAGALPAPVGWSHRPGAAWRPHP
ncbi:acyl-CoA carboxylase epsilon subunit [Streptomyces ficellus]|uniref:acyl-CoA carboxylase epsilon subunit n=1 Tax=Streptomyces ficellus TaxID=1977088 RepID=UPI00142EADF6|nr:acyl-CoA carboxylase epsilon subunit [Streptomyces ficellus]